MTVKAAVARGLHVDGRGRALLFLSRARHPEVHRGSPLAPSVGTASAFMRRVDQVLPVPPRVEPVARVLSFASPAPVPERPVRIDIRFTHLPRVFIKTNMAP